MTTTSSAINKPDAFHITVQPLYGYEKAVKFYPTIHYRDRFMVGARFIAGYLALAGEGEFTRATDTENFYEMALLTDPTVKIKDTTDRLKLGIRRTWDIKQKAEIHGRFGGQASRNTHEFTNAGATTVTKEKIKVAPYLGAGIGVNLYGKVMFVGDGVIVVNNIYDLQRTEYQGTGALSYSF